MIDWLKRLHTRQAWWGNGRRERREEEGKEKKRRRMRSRKTGCKGRGQDVREDEATEKDNEGTWKKGRKQGEEGTIATKE